MTAIYLRPWWIVLVQLATIAWYGWRLPRSERPVHPHHHVYIGM